MDYTRYHSSKTEDVMIMATAAGTLSVIGVLFYGTIITILAAPLAFLTAKKVYSCAMLRRRRNRLRNGFRDLLNALASSFASGRHMDEAMREAYSELKGIHDVDSEIMKELGSMIERMESGESDISVLSDFDRRAAMEDITLFTQVYGSSREAGGDIVGAMMGCSSMLAEKIKIEKEIDVMTKQKKTEGIMISLMPVMILAFLRIISPDYIEVLYGTPAGILIMTISLMVICYSFIMIRKITDIEV